MPEEESPGIGTGERVLRSSSTETLKRALQYYLEYEPVFVKMFFPLMAERGYVVRADVGQMTARQADALLPLLVDSVRYFERQEAKETKRMNLSTTRPEGSAIVSEVGRKAKLWTDAARDLCEVFDLRFPV
jgi:hypothetical protein